MTGDRMALMIFWYWLLKLKARFLAGDYAEALAAAGKAKLQLSSSSALIHVLDYVYYSALTLAASYETVSTDQQQAWRELLTAHLEQLREWAENYPPTFGDKHVLVSAEIARLEGRDADAMHLYEEAIQSARENGCLCFRAVVLLLDFLWRQFGYQISMPLSQERKSSFQVC